MTADVREFSKSLVALLDQAFELSPLQEREAQLAFLRWKNETCQLLLFLKNYRTTDGKWVFDPSGELREILRIENRVRGDLTLPDLHTFEGVISVELSLDQAASNTTGIYPGDLLKYSPLLKKLTTTRDFPCWRVRYVSYDPKTETQVLHLEVCRS